MESVTLVEPAPAPRTSIVESHPVPERPSSWVWLVPASVLLLFANGRWVIPLASWLAPVLLLRFVRTQRARVGLPVAWVLLGLCWLVSFQGVMPMQGSWYYAIAALYASLDLLPYLLDRWLAPRQRGLLATLVFPCTWVGVEFVLTLTPAATWCATACTQYGNLPLLQVVSVTGITGITFLIGWFASLCNAVWEEGFRSASLRPALIGFVASLGAVFVLGAARMALFPATAPTVRIASLSREKVVAPPSAGAWRRMIQDRGTRADIEELRNWAEAINSDLLRRSEREARAGARIVFWGEGNGMIFKADEPAFIDRGRQLARQQGIYLGMAYSAWTPGQALPRENKLVLIEPSGTVAWEYLKAHPVPGAEALCRPGDGVLPSLDTPYGRLSAVICYDADFPRLLAQAGATATDILLIPAGDWPAIDPLHTRMASFRALEQGVNLVRHTSDGLSAAYDYQGHVLSAMDHYQASDPVMIAQVPTRGTRTIYSRIGDLFAWTCLALLLWAAARGLRRSPVATA